MILRDPHWTDNLSEIVTDKSWSLASAMSGLIYLFTVYNDKVVVAMATSLYQKRFKIS